jgi:hypothetical protein
LDPGEIRILCLSKKTLDWSELRSLQTRTLSDYTAPKPTPVTKNGVKNNDKKSHHNRVAISVGSALGRPA